VNAILAYAGNPANRSGGDDGFQRIKIQPIFFMRTSWEKHQNLLIFDQSLNIASGG
jgi:hypothetical protein